GLRVLAGPRGEIPETRCAGIRVLRVSRGGHRVYVDVRALRDLNGKLKRILRAEGQPVRPPFGRGDRDGLRDHTRNRDLCLLRSGNTPIAASRHRRFGVEGRPTTGRWTGHIRGDGDEIESQDRRGRETVRTAVPGSLMSCGLPCSRTAISPPSTAS